jgi:hypothetical protein
MYVQDRTKIQLRVGGCKRISILIPGQWERIKENENNFSVLDQTFYASRKYSIYVLKRRDVFKYSRQVRAMNLKYLSIFTGPGS